MFRIGTGTNIPRAGEIRVRPHGPWLSWLVLLAGLWASPSLSGAEDVRQPRTVGRLTLTADGKPNAVVIVSGSLGKGGSRGMDPAAQVLTNHIRQISGASLPVLREAEVADAKVVDRRLVLPPGKVEADVIILLGEGQLTKRLSLSTEGLGSSGILIKTSGNVLALLGSPVTFVPGGGSKKGGVSAKSTKAPAGAKSTADLKQANAALNPGAGAPVSGKKGKKEGPVGTGKTKGGSGSSTTLYAVYRFLESLGCRYLWPGESGKIVPHLPTLVVEPLDIRYTPPIGQREIRFLSQGPRNFGAGLAVLGCTADGYGTARTAATATESTSSWSTWQGLGGDIGIHGGHAGCGLRGGWDEHGKAHPEWFALQTDGTRDQTHAGGRWQLCVSNPGLIEHVANDVIQQLNNRPQTTCLSLSPNDGGFSNFCLCDQCKKLDPPDGPKLKMLVFDKVGQAKRRELDYVSLTDRYLRYWNAVVDRVARVHPKVLFLIDAYSYYSDPPVREKLHPNLVVRYVPSTRDGWKGWQAAGARRIYWRPNNLHSGYRDGALKVFGGELASTMSFLADNGMLATDIQGIYDNWATQGLNYYVTARLTWNPQLTYESILDDYCQRGFGPAARAVRQYFQRAESLQGTVAEKYTPEVVVMLRSLLEEGRKAAGDNQGVRRRVSFLRVGLEHTALTAEAYRLASGIKAGEKIDAAAAKALMDRRWQLMRRILQSEPLAVNVALVAGHEEPLRRALSWSGPSAASKASAARKADLDDWLNEDQTPVKRK